RGGGGHRPALPLHVPPSSAAGRGAGPPGVRARQVGGRVRTAGGAARHLGPPADPPGGAGPGRGPLAVRTPGRRGERLRRRGAPGLPPDPRRGAAGRGHSRRGLRGRAPQGRDAPPRALGAHRRRRPGTGGALSALRGRTALVTGGSRGIGRAGAERLARDGAAVAVLSTTDEGSLAVADALRKQGARSLALAADVADPRALDAAVAEVERALGPVEVLVNDAGITLRRPLPEMTDADWDRVL